MKKVALALFFLAGPVAQGDETKGFDHSHSAWDEWLREHVTVKDTASTVDYKKGKASYARLKGYLDGAATVKKAGYESWSPNRRLAFLVNAYNALTVRLILESYPVKSIKDLGSLFKSPWKKQFFTLLGEETSLDGLEHGWIRKQFPDPRLHMALVCASAGCPMLRDEAWLAEKLEGQLEDSVKRFLSDPARNRYDAAENRFTVSKLFDWYESDFKAQAGSVQAFLAKYMGKTAQERTKMKEAKLSYTDYDWSLNEAK
jgi:hypothetical protein